MKRRGMVLAALAASLAGSVQAQPSPHFDLFRSLCADTNADRALSLAKADALGWAAMPAETLTVLAKRGFVPSDGRIDPSRVYVVVLGSGERTTASVDVRADMCLLVANPGKLDELRQAAAAWINMAPAADIDPRGRTIYMFREQSGRRAKLATEASASFLSAAKDGSARLMVLDGDSDAAMATYSSFRIQ